VETNEKILVEKNKNFGGKNEKILVEKMKKFWWKK